MAAPTTPEFFPADVGSPAPRFRWWNWRRLGFNFLTVSLLAHLVFGVLATYFVVQRIQTKRALSFQAGPPSPSRSQRAVEHTVQVAKQRQSSAPAAPRRVVVAGLAKVSLPEMPTVAVATGALSQTKLSGVGGAGSFGLGPGAMPAAAAVPGGGRTSLFGFKENRGSALVGTFYDLKQDRNGQPTGMTPEQYDQIVTQFVRGGMNETMLANYFRSPQPLYASQIFVPNILAEEGPRAFQVEKQVQPRLWLALYRGRVQPPEGGGGRYHFVGVGDDVLVVSLQGKVVLDHGTFSPTGRRPAKRYVYGYYSHPWYLERGHGVGDEFTVSSMATYDLRVLIGEQPGGACQYQLMVEKVGATYKKDDRGNPILPIFRLAPVPTPEGAAPPTEPDGPVWREVSSGLNPTR